MASGYAAREIGGHPVGVLDEGPEDAPRVVFLHCSLAFAGLWKGVTARLSGRWRCLSIDLPAHGLTAPPAPGVPLQFRAVDDLAGVVAAAGGAPVHLVGLSLGGAVAARAAVRRPGLARSLTLIEPVLFHLLRGEAEAMGAENLRIMAPCTAAVAEGRLHDGARAFMEAWGQPGQFDRMPQRLRDAVAASLAHVAADFPMGHGWPPGQIGHDDIAGLALPALLMEGSETQPSAKAILDELQRLLPLAERATVAGAGHLSPVDAPEAVAARLAAFFEAAEAGRGAGG